MKIVHLILLSALSLFIVSCSAVPTAPQKNTAAKYTANWDSLKQFQCPQWFRDAKFGIYFHWGPYSVPAYQNEWYTRNMYIPGSKAYKHHIKTYGPLDKFGYKDFIPMFTAEKFDADAWTDLFVKAGAKFAGPVAEHADGFVMWDSKLTRWNAARMGPKRDIVGEMEKAIRKTDMKFIATLHHQWLYAWYPTLDKTTDASNPELADLYGPPAPRKAFKLSKQNKEFLPDDDFCQRWLSHSNEVVDKYHPDLVWFDSKLDIIKEQYLIDFLTHYYNSAESWGRPVLATYKNTDFAQGTAVIDLERSRLSSLAPYPWLTDDSIDWNSWCDVQDPDYKSPDRIIDTLVDIVSKNGCLLLNITPRANGEIPQPVQDRLLAIGQWLKINGKAIYNTRPWLTFGEGPTKVTEGFLNERQNKDNTAEDIRFTTRDGILYAIILDWPKNNSCLIKTLKSGGLLSKEITSVHLLGSSAPLSFQRDAAGLKVQLPAENPGRFAYVLEIKTR